MARAKRTVRTEARRRHRAEQAALVELEPGVDDDDAPSTTGSSRTQSKQVPPARPGIMASFRGAMRPLDLLGDLKAPLPVLTNWGFLAATALTAVGAIWFILAYNDATAAIPVGSLTDELRMEVLSTSPIPAFIGQMTFLVPPPAIGAFLIGFMAKRASYLGGLLYGIIVVVFAIVILQFPAGRLMTLDDPAGSAAVIANQAALSPVGSALFASAAAWYRRFLELASPNRNRPRPTKGQPGRRNAKPNARSSTR